MEIGRKFKNAIAGPKMREGTVEGNRDGLKRLGALVIGGVAVAFGVDPSKSEAAGKTTKEKIGQVISGVVSSLEEKNVRGWMSGRHTEWLIANNGWFNPDTYKSYIDQNFEAVEGIFKEFFKTSIDQIKYIIKLLHEDKNSPNTSETVQKLEGVITFLNERITNIHDEVGDAKRVFGSKNERDYMFKRGELNGVFVGLSDATTVADIPRAVLMKNILELYPPSNLMQLRVLKVLKEIKL
jgi:hypothetical protein